MKWILTYMCHDTSYMVTEPVKVVLHDTLFSNKVNTTVSIDQIWASQGALVVKNLLANAGEVTDEGSNPGSGRSPRGGHGNPLVFLPGESHGQRSLKGYRITRIQTWLKRLNKHMHGQTSCEKKNNSQMRWVGW